MSLLVVGSIALDSVITPFGETADDPGGSAVFFSAAAALLHPVQVVGVVGRDFDDVLVLGSTSLTGIRYGSPRPFPYSSAAGFAVIPSAIAADTALRVKLGTTTLSYALPELADFDAYLRRAVVPAFAIVHRRASHLR